MKKTFLFLAIVILLMISLTACNMPGRSISSADKTATIDASVAETVAARGVTSTEPSSGGSETITDTPDPGPGDPPTSTPQPDTQTPSETPIPCNLGRFVTDITIPDGTVFEPGEVFTKTWRLRNVGSCAWTSGYDIVFSGGDAMNGASPVQVTAGTVNPGQSVDISVDLTAPGSAGTYRGNWQLRDPSDVIFGIENSSSELFWVEIEVIVPTDTPAAVSATLHTSSYSGSMSVGGSDSIIKLGIAPNGYAIRAFVDFDLSALASLSSSSAIQSATLDVSDYTGSGCFNFLHPLKAGQINYGAIKNYPSDFNQSPSASIFEVPSGLGISGPINITSILQNYVSSNGAGHFQFRMELEGDDSGAAFNCMMQWSDPLINITFLP
ncbi:MAG: NBR1-Ig-like domain-containing protein [Anaerolineales bacterium]